MEENLKEIKEEIEKMDMDTLKKSLAELEQLIKKIDELQIERENINE